MQDMAPAGPPSSSSASNAAAAKTRGEQLEMGKVFVGGLSRDTTTSGMRLYFERFGDISDCVVMKDRSTGAPRGFGFVTYASQAIADRVVLHRHVIDGKEVEAKPAVPRDSEVLGARNGLPLAPATFCVQPPGSHAGVVVVPHGAGGEISSKKIFVGGLSHETSETDFVGYFGTFGQVVDCVIMCDPHTRKPRGFGFITYESTEAVDRVCITKFHDLNGKRVEVKRAIPQDRMPSEDGMDGMSGSSAIGASGYAVPHGPGQSIAHNGFNGGGRSRGAPPGSGGHPGRGGMQGQSPGKGGGKPVRPGIPPPPLQAWTGNNGAAAEPGPGGAGRGRAGGTGVRGAALPPGSGPHYAGPHGSPDQSSAARNTAMSTANSVLNQNAQLAEGQRAPQEASEHSTWTPLNGAFQNPGNNYSSATAALSMGLRAGYGGKASEEESAPAAQQPGMPHEQQLALQGLLPPGQAYATGPMQQVQMQPMQLQQLQQMQQMQMQQMQQMQQMKQMPGQMMMGQQPMFPMNFPVQPDQYRRIIGQEGGEHPGLSEQLMMLNMGTVPKNTSGAPGKE